MKETTKSKHYWTGHYALVGIGLDVGAGDDPLPIASAWVDHEWRRENAKLTRNLEEYKLARAHKLPFPDKYFDWIYSSHCLEHCEDLVKTIEEWRRVARDYLYIVVPHFYYYEKNLWPSVFNKDHKHSFELEGEDLTDLIIRRNHWIIGPSGLENGRGERIPLNIIGADLQKDNFDPSRFYEDQTLNSNDKVLSQIQFTVKL